VGVAEAPGAAVIKTNGGGAGASAGTALQEVNKNVRIARRRGKEVFDMDRIFLA